MHAMRRIFVDENTEAIFLVDAENAFNNLNRSAPLSNIKQLCPPFFRYLHNTYQKPAKLVIPDPSGYDCIYSEESCTQGDVMSMIYALGIRPLVDCLVNAVNTDKCKQAWYADDSSSAGKLSEMKKGWEQLCLYGPSYGYYPLARKTILIVKERFKTKAQEIFGDSGIEITSTSEAYGSCYWQR